MLLFVFFVLSTIYDWFQEDFGSSEESVISHIKQYANSGLLEQLNTIDPNKIRYAYDWKLNELNELPPQ